MTAFVSLRERIRSEDPIRPSIRVANSDRLEGMTELYRVSAKKLIQQIRGDLDWIVLRCLEKNPVQRYQTASELWGDLRQFLRCEPIAARPHGLAYTLGKLMRRHRVAFATAASICVLLMTSALIIGAMAVRLSNANSLAVDAGALIRDAMSVSTQDVMPGSLGDPREIGTRLAVAGQNGDRFNSKNPLAEAALRESMGVSYASIGWDGPAIENLEKALAIYRNKDALGDDRWVAVAGRLARTHSLEGRYRQAQLVATDALSILLNSRGWSHPKTAAFATALAFCHLKQGEFDAAQHLAETVVSRWRATHPIISLQQLEQIATTAPAYLDPGRRRPASIDPVTLDAMSILARVSAGEGNGSSAEELARMVVAVRRYTRGSTEWRTLGSLRLLGDVYAADGKFALAADSIVEAELSNREFMIASDPGHSVFAIHVCGFSDTPFDDVARPWWAEWLIEQSSFPDQQSRLEHPLRRPMSDCEAWRLDGTPFFGPRDRS